MLAHFTLTKGGKGRKERRKEGSEQERGRRETEQWENSQVKGLDVP